MQHFVLRTRNADPHPLSRRTIRVSPDLLMPLTFFTVSELIETLTTETTPEFLVVPGVIHLKQVTLKLKRSSQMFLAWMFSFFFYRWWLFLPQILSFLHFTVLMRSTSTQFFHVVTTSTNQKQN